MTDKTKSKTFNFLSENKSIEDIKKEPNIKVKKIKNKRHSGQTYRIDNADHQLINHDLSENNTKNLEPVKKDLENTDIIFIYELIKVGRKYSKIILNTHLDLEKFNAQNPELEKVPTKKENKELKNEIEKLKLKQNNVNFDKFKYNAMTIYDQKQSKKTGIEKIHEEILPIEDKVFFITTLVHINQSISEEMLCFQQFQNGDIEIMKQLKQYENLNGYKNDFSLIEDTLIDKNNSKYKFTTIKEFLNEQQYFKLRPTKTNWTIWVTIFGITLFLLVVGPICTFAIPTLIPATATALLLETKIIIAISFAIGGLIFKGISSIFENSTKKVHLWIKLKVHSWICKRPFINKRNFDKIKEEKEIKDKIKNNIENLTSDKLETKLQTQYDILKQELDNRKNKNPDKLISNETINHNSNNISENLNIESKNQNFDSSVRDTINQQEQQPSTSSNHNWNKVKCLLT